MTRKKVAFSKAHRVATVVLSSVLFCMPVVMLGGCSSEEDTNKDSTTTQTDTQRIANANFEYFKKNDGKNAIITSIDGWSKSVGLSASGDSASSSIRASGIVDTNKSAWENLTASSVVLTDENVDAEWDNSSVFDRLTYYKKYSVDSTSDYENYVPYNVTIDDVPSCENPGTHDYNATEDRDEDTNVLMLHNYRSDRYGTAQKYTSSTTVNLTAGTSAKLSVWVKTSDLTFNGGTEVNGNRGAYISVSQTFSGYTLEPLLIQNIDTSSVTENNGWKLYTMYLKGNDLSDTTFQMTLGLGQGGGSDKFGYVEGYAFFDDVSYEILTNEEYEAYTEGVDTVYVSEKAEMRTFDADKTDKTVFASDLSFERTKLSSQSVSFAPTKEKSGTVYYTSVPDGVNNVYKGLSLDTASDTFKSAKWNDLIASDGNVYFDQFVKDNQVYPFDNERTILLLSAGGGAYTASVTAPSFTLQANTKAILSFYVKTSKLNGYTGASATIVDGEERTTIAAFDSTTVATVDTDNEKDIFAGWVRCTFLIQNETKSSKTFSLELSYGPTSIVGTTNASYLPGYAAFTNLTFDEVDDERFASVPTGTYCSSVSLFNNTKTSSASGFDDVDYSDETSIENGLAIPKNYTGVEGGSSYVGGEDYCYANSNENAGLLNKNYANAYWNNNETWMSSFLKIASANDVSLTNALNADNWWNKIIGSANQPLLIVNTIEQAYGYIGSVQALSANSYTAVSVRVKVSEGAIAYVYLMDASSLSDGYNTPLTISTPNVSYWYDDDNNVCSVDPSSVDFNEKTDVVYLYNNNDDSLPVNSLYKRADGADDKNYANLSNYEKDEDGNLVTEAGTVAFWFHDGEYYAHYNEDKDVYSVPVSDFDHAYARYTAQAKECVTVIDGNDPTLANKWITVNFFIHTAADSKNYRLEVFSGSRDGSVKSAKDSYVLFDSVSAPSLSSNYAGLLADAIESIQENAPADYKEDDVKWYENAIYYTYSFHDDASYLRYDEANDADDVGDRYTDYTQSSYSETVAYLYYEDRTTDPENYSFSAFVDYSPIDVTVPASEVDTDDDVEEEEKVEPAYNVWLLASSIILAVVLFAVAIILAVRKIMKKVRINKIHATNAYVAVERKKKHYKKTLKLKDE